MNPMQRSRRLIEDLERIQRLSVARGPVKDKWTIAVSVVVVGGWLLLFQHWHDNDFEQPAPVTRAVPARSSGPLSKYVVEGSGQDLVPCTDPVCTYPIIQPIAVHSGERVVGRYLAPTVQIIRAPTGRVFHMFPAILFDGYTSTDRTPRGYVLARQTPADENAVSYAASDVEDVVVQTQGYLRAVTVAASGQRIALRGTVTGPAADTSKYAGGVGHAYLAGNNPPLSELEFQPVENTMSFELPDTQGWTPTPGDPAEVHFETGVAPDNYADASRFNDKSAIQVATVTRLKSPARLNVTLSLNDQALYWLLRKRVGLERNAGLVAFPESARVDFLLRYGRAEGQVIRVPASAIVSNGDTPIVWIVVDGYAVPVAVDSIGRDGQSVAVIEKTGARGLPIRVADWLALTPYARSKVYLMARRIGAGENKLLTPGARVISRPDGKLRAGETIRIQDAAG
jgi:hypothetical protein